MTARTPVTSRDEFIIQAIQSLLWSYVREVRIENEVEAKHVAEELYRTMRKASYEWQQRVIADEPEVVENEGVPRRGFWSEWDNPWDAVYDDRNEPAWLEANDAMRAALIAALGAATPVDAVWCEHTEQVRSLPTISRWWCDPRLPDCPGPHRTLLIGVPVAASEHDASERPEQG